MQKRYSFVLSVDIILLLHYGLPRNTVAMITIQWFAIDTPAYIHILYTISMYLCLCIFCFIDELKRLSSCNIIKYIMLFRAFKMRISKNPFITSTSTLLLHPHEFLRLSFTVQCTLISWLIGQDTFNHPFIKTFIRVHIIIFNIIAAVIWKC